jgi:large subunit ribosomal protein L31
MAHYSQGDYKMRDGIHPDYKLTEYTCSCGSVFETHSTKGGAMRVELCNKCHPFFTGTQKFVDTGGRVQRFADKFGAAAAATLEKEKAATEARRAEAEAKDAKKIAAREEKAAAKAARAAEFEKNAPAEDEATEEVVVAEETVSEPSAGEVVEKVVVEEDTSEKTDA